MSFLIFLQICFVLSKFLFKKRLIRVLPIVCTKVSVPLLVNKISELLSIHLFAFVPLGRHRKRGLANANPLMFIIH